MHVVGVRTWNSEQAKPHLKQFGVRNIGAMVGDNVKMAKTETGQFKGLLKMNYLMFDKEMFVVGCYPNILKCTYGFGSFFLFLETFCCSK